MSAGCLRAVGRLGAAGAGTRRGVVALMALLLVACVPEQPEREATSASAQTAEATPDGKGAADGVLAFRVTPPPDVQGQTPAASLLLPSRHYHQPGLLRPGPEVLDGRRALVVETDPDGRAHPETMRTGSHDFVALFGERGAELVRSRLRCGGVHFPEVAEPFAVWRRSTVRCPAERRGVRIAPALLEGVDFEREAEAEARRRGLPVLFAETREEMWRYTIAVPPEVYFNAARREVADPSAPQRRIEARPARNALLNQGALDALYALQREEFGGSEEDWREFERFLLVGRNAVMARRLDRHLRDPGAVLALLGAAHFPGPHGVVERLRAMGHRVEPVRLPPGRWPARDGVRPGG